MTWPRPVIAVLMFALVAWAAPAQEKSVKPGINVPFKNPDVMDFEKKFEGESREVSAKRGQIVAACKLKPGTVVADVGAGTGLFTRLFAKEIGADGQVYAVDIAQSSSNTSKRPAGRRGCETLPRSCATRTPWTCP
jgi:predicted methyltransferase